jgi:mercuric ion transport protein
MRAPARVRTGELGSGSNRDSAAGTGNGLLAAGGIVAALGASSCCVVPLVLFMLGISGAWIGNLTALAPYQPLFVAAAVGFLALGFVRVYGRPKPACAEGSYCARPASARLAKLGLWAATALVIVAVAFPYVARFILET